VLELVNLAVALSAAGLDDRAGRLVDQAVAAVSSVVNAGQQAVTLIRVAARLAATGSANTAWLDVVDADTTADDLLGDFPPTPSEEACALVTLAARSPAAGLRSQARDVAVQAEQAARAISDHGERAQRLTAAATVLAAVGLRDRATQAAIEAEAAAYSVTVRDERTEVLARLAKKRLPAKKDDLTPITEARVLTDLAKALAAAGLQDLAEQIILQAVTVALAISDMDAPGASLTDVVEELAAAGLLKQARQAAEELEDIRQFTRASDQAWVLSRMVEVFTAAGLDDQARQVADLVETIARKITGTQPRAWAMLRATQALAAAGLHDRAARAAGEVETAAHQITGSDELADLAAELATAGSFDQAESVARAISAQPRKAKALIQIAKAQAVAGLHDRARQLASEAEALAYSLTAQHNDQLLAEVAEALSAAGSHERAESIARAITGQLRKAQALVDVAKGLAAAGLHDRALAMADEAETIARAIAQPEIRAELAVMPKWTQSLAHHLIGDADWAEGESIWEEMQSMAGSLRTSVLQPELLTGVAEVLAIVGSYEKAEVNIAAIAKPEKRALALISVAKILADTGQPARSRQLLAQALSLGSWVEFLPMQVLPQEALIAISTPLLR
jgi:tetratricopeptide (TPR) repeat protein